MRRSRVFPWDDLPNVETQTIAFFEAARRMPRDLHPTLLYCRGYRLYIRYWRNQPVHGQVRGELLVIASVSIPLREQRCGWFWRYCQLCLALARDGIILECVNNKDVYAALKRRQQFVEYEPRTFLLEKSGPGDWPLQIETEF